MGDRWLGSRRADGQAAIALGTRAPGEEGSCLGGAAIAGSPGSARFTEAACSAGPAKPVGGKKGGAHDGERSAVRPCEQECAPAAFLARVAAARAGPAAARSGALAVASPAGTAVAADQERDIARYRDVCGTRGSIGLHRRDSTDGLATRSAESPAGVPAQGARVEIGGAGNSDRACLGDRIRVAGEGAAAVPALSASGRGVERQIRPEIDGAPAIDEHSSVAALPGATETGTSAAVTAREQGCVAANLDIAAAGDDLGIAAGPQAPVGNSGRSIGSATEPAGVEHGRTGDRDLAAAQAQDLRTSPGAGESAVPVRDGIGQNGKIAPQIERASILREDLAEAARLVAITRFPGIGVAGHEQIDVA